MPRKTNHREIWRHNSFFGHAAMMKANARSIYDSPTTSGVAKRIAMEINRLAGELALALKERVDP